MIKDNTTKKPFGFVYFNILEQPIRFVVFCALLPYLYCKQFMHTLYVAYRAFKAEISRFWDYSHREASGMSNYVIERGIPKILGHDLPFQNISIIPYGALLAMGSGGRDTDKIAAQAFELVQEKNKIKREKFAKSKFDAYGKMCHDHHIKAQDLNT